MNNEAKSFHDLTVAAHGARRSAIEARILWPNNNPIDKWIAQMPDKFDLFRGSCEEEYNGIIKHENPPGLWWSLHIRKALHYTTNGKMPGVRGMLILRDCTRAMLETALPYLNEVTIYEEGWDYSKMVEFIPLSEIISFIGQKYKVQDTDHPFNLQPWG